jgi:hypothetical protein
MFKKTETTIVQLLYASQKKASRVSIKIQLILDARNKQAVI